MAVRAVAQPPGGGSPPPAPGVGPGLSAPTQPPGGGSLPPPAPAPDAIPAPSPGGFPGPGGGPQPVQPSAVTQPFAPPPPVPPGQPARFHFQIDPNTPAKDLLPLAPKMGVAGPVLTDDLTKVPEVAFAAQPEKITNDDKLTVQAAHQLAKINHMNAKKTDAFMIALLENRPDLAGLPFAMGDKCRSTGDRVKYFTQAADLVRRALGGSQGVSQGTTRATFVVNQPVSGLQSPQGFSGGMPGAPGNFGLVQQVQVNAPLQPFWQTYATLCEQEDSARARPDKPTTEHVTLARLAALTQMLAAESAEIRLGLVKYLTAVPHVEATKALARMAIVSPEEDVRDAAITALKVRREKDYTDILVQGLRYPWPAVARRSAEAITKLERADLIPELVSVLDSADPRLPVTKNEDGKQVAVVRELVKLNHHRNCMMCHSPTASGSPNVNALQAEVAVQGQPLPTPAEGYRQSTAELMVRVDVTYLRADFSASMQVKDAHPWPEMQRFDFLVRERKMTTTEAASFGDQLTPKEPGVLSPYHKAAVAALRELTGKDTAPTAEAWRKLLGRKAEPPATRD